MIFVAKLWLQKGLRCWARSLKCLQKKLRELVSPNSAQHSFLNLCPQVDIQRFESFPNFNIFTVAEQFCFEHAGSALQVFFFSPNHVRTLNNTDWLAYDCSIWTVYNPYSCVALFFLASVFFVFPPSSLFFSIHSLVFWSCWEILFGCAGLLCVFFIIFIYFLTHLWVGKWGLIAQWLYDSDSVKFWRCNYFIFLSIPFSLILSYQIQLFLKFPFDALLDQFWFK